MKTYQVDYFCKGHKGRVWMETYVEAQSEIHAENIIKRLDKTFLKFISVKEIDSEEA